MRSEERRPSGERYRTTDDGVEITITRHAVSRYAERARVVGSPRRLSEELRDRVSDAIEENALFPAGETHVVPLRDRGDWLCLVVRLSGPAEKPYAVVVCTVLTGAMAIETFGHIIGFPNALRARPRSVNTRSVWSVAG